MLVEVQWFGTDTRYGLNILQQCEERVKVKFQKVFGANSYVSRSYTGKTSLCDPRPNWIGLKILTPAY